MGESSGIASSKKIRPSNGESKQRRGKSNLTTKLQSIQQKVEKRKKTGKNNNAIPEKESQNQIQNEARSKSDRSSLVHSGKEKLNETHLSFKPIIQTRRMRANAQKEINSQEEIEKLNNIDKLTPFEIAEGDKVSGENEIYHDGVDLCIDGSDFEEDGEICPRNKNKERNEEDSDGAESGEIYSSSDDEYDDEPPKRQVASKVIRANKSPKIAPTSNKTTPDDRYQSKDNLGSRSANGNKYNHLKNDPEFREFLAEIIGDQTRSRNARDHSEHDEQMARSLSDSKGKSKESRRRGMAGIGDCGCTDTIEDASSVVVPNNSNKQNAQQVNYNQQQCPTTPLTFKSPSDTTLYSPGLRKANEIETNVIDHISNFVEKIRLDSNRVSRKSAESTEDSRRVERRSTGSPFPGSSGATVQQQEQQQERTADQLLKHAEKFKARIEALTGTSYDQLLMPYDYEKLRSRFVRPEGLAPLDSEILFLRNFDQDDEFFHITSQIDPSIKTKIERGEFVELERLLPKDRGAGFKSGNEEINKQLFQLIAQGTNNYVDPPAVRTGRINSLRRWEQAFRVYAAIYTRANPERSSEIWQYIYVIHTAAAGNPWDNVYFYDINFRELMASKP